MTANPKAATLLDCRRNLRYSSLRVDVMTTTSELIRRLERKLAALQRIPPRRREAEPADIKEEICQTLLADLQAHGDAPRA